MVKQSKNTSEKMLNFLTFNMLHFDFLVDFPKSLKSLIVVFLENLELS